jgi:hypothetical protein
MAVKTEPLVSGASALPGRNARKILAFNLK